MEHHLTRPPACAVGWQASGLSAWGSAPQASLWVCLEHPGPWGRKAATQTRGLDPAVGEALDALTAAMGGKFVLIRQAVRNQPDGEPLTVLVAGGLATGGWLRRFTVCSPQELLDWLRGWDGRPWDGEDADPALLVCTNAKRDQCCSRFARPVLDALDDLPREQLWESSHLGGHRFAATALVLPTGQALAGLDEPAAREALELAAGRELWPGGRRRDRGRSCLTPERQAAEAWALEEWGPLSAATLVSEELQPGRIRVRTPDREVLVEVGQRTTTYHSRLSCDKEPEPLTEWQVTPLT